MIGLSRVLYEYSGAIGRLRGVCVSMGGLD